METKNEAVTEKRVEKLLFQEISVIVIFSLIEELHDFKSIALSGAIKLYGSK